MEDQLYEIPEEKAQGKFYKRSIFWIENREGIGKVLLGIWLAIEVIVLLFFVWVMLDSFLISYESDRALRRSMLVENQTEHHEVTVQLAARPLAISEIPTVFSSQGGKYDILGFIENPNENWWAEVFYEFTYSGDKTTGTFFEFIYPGDKKPLTALAIEETGRPINPKLEIRDIRWHAIDWHAIPDFDAWRLEHENIIVEEAEFVPAVQLGDEVIGRSNITIRNASAYGYWAAPVVVMLKRSAGIVGVTRTSLDQWASGETKEISINWFGDFPTVTEIEIVPSVQLFDPSVYLTPQGEHSVDTRIQIGQ